MCFLGPPREAREGVRPLFGEPPIWAPGWAISGLSTVGEWGESEGGIGVLSERAKGGPERGGAARPGGTHRQRRWGEQSRGIATAGSVFA